MWAAIRYRPAQALAMLALSALITTCAVFAPLYERALEQSLLLDGLNRYDPIQTALILEAAPLRNVLPQPQKARSAFPGALSSLYDGGSDLWSSSVRYEGVAHATSSVTVLGPQDTCRGLQLVSGVCPTTPFEVAVSEAEAKVQGWSLGARLTALEDVPAVAKPEPFTQPFVVTGFYRQQADPGHWTGFVLEGKAGRTALGPSETPLMDAWVTPESTFSAPAKWVTARLQVTFLLDRSRVSLENLSVIGDSVGTATSTGAAMIPSVNVRSNASDLITGVVEGQRQARIIVPLLMGQLAILAVVVLGLIASAAVEQRRPELALGRLRGRGPSGVARMVMSELGTVVAAGVPVGFLLALGLGALARARWLTTGVPAEVPPSMYVAALVSLLAGLLAVAVVARPTLREPISTLLRRVPPRRRGWRVGILDAIVITVAAAGLVTLASGNVSGPLALATPTLLALALGLLLAHVLVPLADLLARRMTARGNVVGGLTAVQVARRPAVRRVMAIMTVATALTVFATDAVVVGARNREERAAVEAGAEAVLDTNATDIATFLNAVKTADPTGRVATPVVTVRQGSAAAMTTLAVIPGQFAAIAAFPRERDQFDWSAISRTPPPEVVVNGQSLSVTVTDIKLDEALRQGDAPTPLTFQVFLAFPGNSPFGFEMGEFDPRQAGPLTFTAPIACQKGCRVTGFGISTPPAFQTLLRGTLTVGNVSVDGQAPATVGNISGWLPSGEPNAPKEQLLDYAKPIDVGSPTSIGIELQTQRSDVMISSTGSEGAIPALVAGTIPVGSSPASFQAAGLDGVTVGLTESGRLPYVPGGGTDQAVVALDALRQRASQIGATASAQVWLADPTAVPRITTALRSSGVEVRSVELRSDQQALFDSSASAWGLRLALVVGIVSLVIALLVLVLVAATSWRSRARDYAALRMVGVEASTLRRVGLAEQLTVVVVSVVVGVACGVVGAQLAMPIVPFFTVPSTTFPVDTAPAVLPIVIASFAALIALVVTGSVIGIRLAGQASLQRVREQL
ncbi:MAG: hypothetical protein M3Y26_01210 [Actinomycetota bacterium]|nr:hypothetical protein [Actinomycetota bacterium]